MTEKLIGEIFSTRGQGHYQKRSVWRETDMSGKDSPASTTHTGQEFTSKEEEEA